MDAVIAGGPGLKAFAKLLLCLHRLGEYAFVEVDPGTAAASAGASAEGGARSEGASLSLSTVSSARTAFTLVTLRRTFFESLRMETGDVDERNALSNGVVVAAPLRCKLLIKPLLNVFRLKPAAEAQVERCRLRIQRAASVSSASASASASTAPMLIVQFQFKHGVTKTHKLHYEAVEEVVRARYDSARFPHAFSVSPRLISNWLVHFPAAMEEVTLMAGPECLNGDGKVGGIAETASTGDAGWIRFRSFVEGGGSAGGHGSATTDRHALSTEVQLDPGEFDTFAVRQATDLTFNMKEFKAVLSFADALGVALHAHFDRARLPLIFQLGTGDATTGSLTCELVLSTLKDAAVDVKTVIAGKIAGVTAAQRSGVVGKENVAVPVGAGSGFHRPAAAVTMSNVAETTLICRPAPKAPPASGVSRVDASAFLDAQSFVNETMMQHGDGTIAPDVSFIGETQLRRVSAGETTHINDTFVAANASVDRSVFDETVCPENDGNDNEDDEDDEVLGPTQPMPSKQQRRMLDIAGSHHLPAPETVRTGIKRARDPSYDSESGLDDDDNDDEVIGGTPPLPSKQHAPKRLFG